jgi:uncharacterized protein YbjT (DUF2867 family)
MNTAGHPARVLTRDPAHAAHLRGLGGPPVEVVEGNLRDAHAVDAAVHGSDVVISAVHATKELGTGVRQS